MPAGRCAGCGLVDSCRKVSAHVLGCAEFAELFRNNPERCLDPAAEYERVKAQDTSDTRALARERRMTDRFAALEARTAHQAARWRRPPDILED